MRLHHPLRLSLLTLLGAILTSVPLLYQGLNTRAQETATEALVETATASTITASPTDLPADAAIPPPSEMLPSPSLPVAMDTTAPTGTATLLPSSAALPEQTTTASTPVFTSGATLLSLPTILTSPTPIFTAVFSATDTLSPTALPSAAIEALDLLSIPTASPTISICQYTIALNDISGFRTTISSANSNGTSLDVICLAAGTYSAQNVHSGLNAFPNVTTPLTFAL